MPVYVVFFYTFMPPMVSYIYGNDTRSLLMQTRNIVYTKEGNTLMRGLEVLCIFFLFTLLLLPSPLTAFQSDELLLDDEEFGLEGSQPYPHTQPLPQSPDLSISDRLTIPTNSRRKRYSESDSDSKIEFSLEHAFGDSDFTQAGTFSARLKTLSNGGQTLTKLRFSRDSFTKEDTEKFKELLVGDDFYRIRLPSNVLVPPGKDYIISSVKARCLPREGLDEHFVIHSEGVNILALSYGSPVACSYPRQLKLPAKWSFNSQTVLKNGEQAPRAPIFTEEVIGLENVEGEMVKPLERSFWAKYWMYLIPLGLIVMNAVTQAMNMSEQEAGGPAQQPGGAVPRVAASQGAVRRR